MFRDAHIFRRSASLHEFVVPRRGIFHLAFLLALCLGSAGLAAPVRAAPRAEKKIDHLQFSTSPIPVPACAPSKYKLRILTRVDTVTELNGNNVALDGGLDPSVISVTATSSDPDVAEVNPNVATATRFDNLIGKDARFEIKTNAIGSATLTFTGKIAWSGESLDFGPLKVPIQTVHCKFRIVITSILRGSLPSTTESVMSNLFADIAEDTDGTLKGEGQVTWTAKQATPCLEAIQTIAPTKATLYGSLSEDGNSLSVHVSYDRSMFFQQNTIGCGANTSANHQLEFQIPPLDFETPLTAGSQTKPASIQIGDAHLTGTSIITVVPIPNK